MNKTEHLLTCLSEECNEVGQAVSKALRFGLKDGYPDTGRTNEKDIIKEYLDLVGVFQLLQDEGVLPYITENEMYKGTIEKQHRVRKYMEYAKEAGALTPSVTQ